MHRSRPTPTPPSRGVVSGAPPMGFGAIIVAALSILISLEGFGSLMAAQSSFLDLRRPAADAPIAVLTTIAGGEPLEWGGTRLAGGDINGDGIADLVIAAPGGTEDRPSRRGRLYVIFGGLAPPRPEFDRTQRRLPPRPGAPPRPATGADIVIDGWDDFDHFGRALVVADIDADGFADIIAGSPRADGPGNARPDCGEVTVIHGASTLPRHIELSQPPATGVRINLVMGRAAGDTLGTSVDVADLDNDGLPDLIAGAPLAAARSGALGAANVGEVHVIKGGAAMPALIDLAAPPAGTLVMFLYGADPGDQAGSALAAGDFDGDSVPDLAVGARGGDGPGNRRPDSGEIYLVFGSRMLPPSLSLGLRAEAFIAPPDIGDLGGGSLAFGDVNGDGRADLAIGGEFADGRANGRLDAGDVWLLEGRTRERIESLRPPAPAGRTPQTPPAARGPVLIDLGAEGVPGVTTIHGADPGDHTSVGAVVDLDDDGRAELILGAEDSSSRRNLRAGGGEIRIIGGAARLPATMTIFGPVGGGHFGKAVAAVDLNGDTRRELLVSAPQAGQSMSGRVWVLSGAWKTLLAPASGGAR